MRLHAIANVTLTKCAITDYIPHDRQNTACQGTREYGYDRVDVETSFVLVGGDDGPDLRGPSKTLGRSLDYRCTTALHHCTVSHGEEVVLGAGEAGDASRWKWVVFEARATSPQAAGCRPPTAEGCNVLAVETQKGTAMYWVQADAGVAQSPPPPPDRTAAVETLDVLPNSGDKNRVRRVVYSVDLAAGGDAGDIAGRQYELAARGAIRERLRQAPDISTYIVLADSPKALEGRFLISDTYDPGKTGNAGGNCDRRCTAEAGAAITTVLPCDVEAGRRYVNVVAAASRRAAKPGETVDILPGGVLEVTHDYPADTADNPPGERTSCTPAG